MFTPHAKYQDKASIHIKAGVCIACGVNHPDYIIRAVVGEDMAVYCKDCITRNMPMVGYGVGA